MNKSKIYALLLVLLVSLSTTTADITDAYTIRGDGTQQVKIYPDVTDVTVGTYVFQTKDSWIYIASNTSYHELDVRFSTPASGTINPNYEISKVGGGWGEYAVDTDTTVKWTQDGVIRFDLGATGFAWGESTITELNITNQTARYWLRIQRQHNNNSPDMRVKLLLPVDDPIMILSTTAMSITMNIDDSSGTEQFNISNTGTQAMDFTMAFEPTTTVLEISRLDANPITTDIPAHSEAVYVVTFNPTVAGTTVTELVLTCPECLLSLEQRISITATANVPVHLQSVAFPSSGDYRLNDELTITATYNTSVYVDDSRIAVYLRLQIGDSLSGSIFGIASLDTPLNTNTTTLSFVFPVDASVPNNRTMFVTSSSIEIPSSAHIWKSDTGIVLAGTNGNVLNVAFSDPNPTGINVDGTLPSITSISIEAGVFVFGDTMIIQCEYDEDVSIVNNGGVLMMDFAGTVVEASAISYGGLSRYVNFTYTIGVGLEARAGISITSLNAPNGTFIDSFNNAASTSVPSLFFQNVVVDSTVPTVQSWQVPSASETHGPGSVLSFTAILSESVEFSDVSLLITIGGGSDSVATSSFSPSSTISFFYSVPTTESGAVSAASLTINGYIQDILTNNSVSGSLAASGLNNVVIDSQTPSLVAVVFPDTSSAYLTGSNFIISVDFNENLNLQGDVKLEFRLLPNGPIVQSDVGSKDGSTSPRLRFSYPVQVINNEPQVYTGISDLKIISAGGGIISDVVDHGNGNQVVLPAILTYSQTIANQLKLDTTGQDPNALPQSNTGTSTGALAGGIAGAAVGAALLAWFAFYGRQRYRQYLLDKLPDFQKFAYISIGNTDNNNKNKKNATKNDDDASSKSAEGRAKKELREIMLANDSDLAYALIECLPGPKLNSAIRSVLYFYSENEQNRKSVNFIKRCISVKIQEAMSAGKSNLFRTDNSATKSLAIFFRMVGLPYLYTIVGDTIKSTSTIKVELDPTRMESDDDTDLSRYTLLQNAQMVLVNVIKKLPLMPPEFRDLCRHLDREARFYADENPDRIAQIAVAGLIFLRFICPAISAPTAYGFVKDRPDADKRRLLTLITKTIQNLANNVKFGGKEPYMQRLNDFIDANSDKMDKYLKDIVDDKIKCEPEELARPVPPAGTSEWCLSQLLRLFQSNFAEISPKLGTKLRDALSRVVASSLPSIPKKSEWQLFGYLVKRGGSYQSWKKRFFILKDLFIWYMKRDTSTGPLGVICLEGCAILPTEDGFSIDHPYARTYHIRCELADKKKWMNALNEKIKNFEVLKEKQNAHVRTTTHTSIHAPMDIELSNTTILNSKHGSARTTTTSREAASQPNTTNDDDDEGETELLENNPMHVQSSSDVSSILSTQFNDLSAAFDTRERKESQFALEAISNEVKADMDDVNGRVEAEEEEEELRQRGWDIHYTDDGTKYYTERNTGESRWTKPTFGTEISVIGHRPEFISMPSLPDILENSSSNANFANNNDDMSTNSNNKSLPDGWTKHISDTGLPYYHNSTTGETQWDFPVL